MKNSKLVIVGLISLGLGYYFGIKKGDKDATIRFMKLQIEQENNKRRDNA